MLLGRLQRRPMRKWISPCRPDAANTAWYRAATIRMNDKRMAAPVAAKEEGKLPPMAVETGVAPGRNNKKMAAP
jgi:hypothetical protein